MLTDIFLSYDGRDLERAKRLATALSSQGWTVFYDRTIPPGKTWRQFIGNEIDSCRSMVVAWSSYSIDSHWVLEEADSSLKRNILLPIFLDPVQSPWGFRSIQAADFTHWQGDTAAPEFLALCASIIELIGPGKLKSDEQTQLTYNKTATETIQQAPIKEPVSQRVKESASAQFRWHSGLPKIIVITVVLVLVIAFFSYQVPYLSSRPAPEINPDKDAAAVNLIMNKPAEPVQLLVVPKANQIEEPEMVKLPGGTFDMGSNNGEDDEKPIHEVTVAGFSMGRTEVTFDEYDRFVEATGKAKPDDYGWGRGKHPVIRVSWQDAVDYAAWLSKETGKNFYLPSEAQWEYAARAGTKSDYYWDQKEADQYAWFSANSDGKAHPVGEQKPNAFGLYDMSGNVWEWVQDCWHDSYADAPSDGSSWQQQKNGSCSQRLLRGGSCFNVANSLRSANRLRNSPDDRSIDYGFRLAQD
jgi:formylglycine-generating enzyme required for sulfatase activity